MTIGISPLNPDRAHFTCQKFDEFIEFMKSQTTQPANGTRHRQTTEEAEKEEEKV